MSDKDPRPHYTVRILQRRSRKYTLHVYPGGVEPQFFNNGGKQWWYYWNEERMETVYERL
jgi:hypothetical protein